ncbi:MAG TPA: hypothetical protein VFG45_09115, partial [Candidatus Nitrosocosmicus sp.]|nr:hypothetical protein [Candidatus Nitrosocosmicus sp.]
MMLKNKTNKNAFSLILIVVSIVFFSENIVEYSYAQNNSDVSNQIASCGFVQFCSNPTVIESSSPQSNVISPGTLEPNLQTSPDSETQTSPDSEVIPDVTSNISLIMTPDLPSNLAEEDTQNALSTSEDPISGNQSTNTNANDSMPTFNPKNTTIITPSSGVQQNTTNENTTNFEEPSQPIINIGQSNQSVPENESFAIGDSTAANETIDSTAANETIDSTAANETIDSTA